jgi:hypothetical protein
LLSGIEEETEQKRILEQERIRKFAEMEAKQRQREREIEEKLMKTDEENRLRRYSVLGSGKVTVLNIKIILLAGKLRH